MLARSGIPRKGWKARSVYNMRLRLVLGQIEAYVIPTCVVCSSCQQLQRVNSLQPQYLRRLRPGAAVLCVLRGYCQT